MATTTSSFRNIDEFVLHRPPLGYGKFGVVFGATHTTTGQRCAIKRVSKARLAKLQTDATEEHHMHATVTQARAPFVIKLFAWFEDERHIYTVLELADGGDLYTYQAQRPMPIECARKWTYQLVRAIDACERAGVLHRDLKPENILLTSSNPATAEVRLADFGWATHASYTGTGTCGTPDYLSPEQTMCRGYDARINAWGVGILLYEMLHGHTPFERPKMSDTYRAVRKGCQEVTFAPFCPDDARDLIERLLQIDPVKRLSMGDTLSHSFFRSMCE